MAKKKSSFQDRVILGENLLNSLDVNFGQFFFVVT